MRSCGFYYDDDCIEVECFKFCYMFILWDEFYWVVRLWNFYWIWFLINVEFLFGRFDVLFFFLEVLGIRNYMVDVDLDELDFVEERCCYWFL